MFEMFALETSTALNERQADELIERIASMTDLARDYHAGADGAQATGEAF